jgi:CHAT domain-containing protein
LGLLKQEAHVFHFIGHGYFDQTSLDGMLALENERGHSKMVSSERLAVVLGNHPSLRLAILNACEGGRASVQDPFARLPAWKGFSLGLNAAGNLREVFWFTPPPARGRG